MSDGGIPDWHITNPDHTPFEDEEIEDDDYEVEDDEEDDDYDYELLTEL